MATKIFNRTTAATCTALASLAAVGFTWNQQRQWRSTHLDAAQQSHNAALKLDNDPPARKPISTWKPPQRQDVLQSMKSGEEYDLLIIGGGATGTGVALDAASRGLKVALVERDDFASGTSSKSTKLVHGGVRYLEKAVLKMDLEQYNLVEEALAERYTVLKVAPYLATSLPIMCPIYKWWQVPYYWLGTKAYDLVAGRRGLESSYFLTKSQALREFPMLKSESLCGAVVYFDGQQNDSRMNVALALTASYCGADVINHVEVTSLKKREGDKESPQQQLCGAVVRDMITGETWDIKAKGIINATGPFTDGIRKMDEPDCQNIIAPSSGTHIVLPHYYSPDHMGLIDPATSDGRVIFFLPWEGNTVAGTTDKPTEISFNPTPSEDEIEFILGEVGHYLSPDIKVRRGDVLSAWTGIRPLVRNPNAKDTQSLVRNHLIYVSPSGLVTVAGGKWTTYRKMAEEAVDKAIDQFELSPRTACQTENILLIGSHGYNPRSYIQLIQHFGMETDVADHLVHNYGDRAFAVAALASETGSRWPVMGRRLAYPYLFIEAEVRYACQREYACTAVDVLARRTRLAFLNAQAAADALPRIVEIMMDELKWSQERAQQEYVDALSYLKTMGLDLQSSRAVFNREQIGQFKREFIKLDSDADGMVRIRQLVDSGLLPAVPKKYEPVSATAEVDFNEFLDLIKINNDENKARTKK